MLFGSEIYDRSLGRKRILSLKHLFNLNLSGNPINADILFQGNYNLAGYSLNTQGKLPWKINAPKSWQKCFHSFVWLDDFSSTNSETAAKHARYLIKQWMIYFFKWNNLSWQIPIIAQRLEYWCRNSLFLTNGADKEFVSLFVTSISRQTRHLQRWNTLHSNIIDRIQFGLALYISAISMHKNKTKALGLKILEKEIEENFQPDGSIIGCNPSEMLEVFRKLTVLSKLNEQSLNIDKEVISSATKKIGDAINVLRHTDEKLTVFNGSYEEEEEYINRIFLSSQKRTTNKKIPLSLPHAGFERLNSRRILIIAKSGTSAGSFQNRIGPLSFELSVGKERLVVNCGTFFGENNEWKKATLNNSAYSTITIEDSNPEPNIKKTGVEAALRGNEEDSSWMELRHNGYRKKFGLIHVRRLHIHSDGHEVVGIDSIVFIDHKEQIETKNAVLRFHLHPYIKASQVGEGTSVILSPNKGQGWIFETNTEKPKLEESVYLGKKGTMRRTHQIIVPLTIKNKETNITWHFTKLPRK